MRLLIVDDEAAIRSILRRYAQIEGYEVLEAQDGAQAVTLCLCKDIDIMIMDVMMPNLDGFSAYSEISRYKQIPCIMLSAKGEEYDKLHGFKLGLDDYVVKPFSPKEVMARLAAVMKRNNCVAPSQPQMPINFEGLVIDFVGRNIIIDGKRADLKPKEYDLLFYFVKNRNIALSRDMLLDNVWGYDFCGDSRTVDAHVKMLRADLKKYRKFIVTLRGMGYKFEV